MAQSRSTLTAQPAGDNITPAQMAASGVPLALARWYHVIGSRLRRFSDWDVERIMQVRLQVELAGSRS